MGLLLSTSRMSARGLSGESSGSSSDNGRGCHSSSSQVEHQHGSRIQTDTDMHRMSERTRRGGMSRRKRRSRSSTSGSGSGSADSHDGLHDVVPSDSHPLEANRGAPPSQRTTKKRQKCETDRRSQTHKGSMTVPCHHPPNPAADDSSQRQAQPQSQSRSGTTGVPHAAVSEPLTHSVAATSDDAAGESDDADDVATVHQRRSAFTAALANVMSQYTSYFIRTNISKHEKNELMDRIVGMIEEDSKRPVEHSLIDLNQTDLKIESPHLYGKDFLMYLISFARRRYGQMTPRYATMTELMARRDQLFNNSVWPHVTNILSIPIPRAHFLNINGRTRVRYDVTRVGDDGATALHYVCESMMEEGSGLHRVAERLLTLGADVHARDGIRATPLIRMLRCNIVRPFFAIKLLLDAGSDISAQDDRGFTCVHYLIECAQLNLLQTMYTQLPHHMCKVDYSLKDRDGRNVIQYAEWMIDNSFGSKEQPAVQQRRNIHQLLKAERDKLYTGIRTVLHDSTPLKLNDDSDLASTIFSYVVAEDEP